MWVWVVAEFLSSGLHWDCFPQVGGRARTHAPVLRGGASSTTAASISGQDQMAPRGPWISTGMVCMALGDNTDSSYSRTMDPDLALGSSLGLDVTMALGGSAGLPYQHSSGSSLLSFQQSLRLQPRPWASAQPLVVTEATAVYTVPSCGKITKPDGSQEQPRSDVTVTLGSSAGHQPQPVLAFASLVPVPPFSTAYELFRLGRPVGVFHPPCGSSVQAVPRPEARNSGLLRGL